MISTSKTRASCGRVCLLFAAASAALSWVGPRPADVLDGTQTPDAEAVPGVQLVEVNVKVSGIRDTDLLAKLRARAEGNTFGSVPLFDALTPEQRAEVAAQHPVWAEWMPYQVGQAAKADKATELLATEVAELTTSLSSARSDISNVVGRVGPLETKVGTLETSMSNAQSSISGLASKCGSDIRTVENRLSLVEERPASLLSLTSSPGTEDAIGRAFAACKTLANHVGNDGSGIIGVVHRMIDGPHTPGERTVPVHGTTCSEPNAAPDHDAEFATNPQDAPKRLKLPAADPAVAVETKPSSPTATETKADPASA